MDIPKYIKVARPAKLKEFIEEVTKIKNVSEVIFSDFDLSNAFAVGFACKKKGKYIFRTSVVLKNGLYDFTSCADRKRKKVVIQLTESFENIETPTSHEWVRKWCES